MKFITFFMALFFSCFSCSEEPVSEVGQIALDYQNNLRSFDVSVEALKIALAKKEVELDIKTEIRKLEEAKLRAEEEKRRLAEEETRKSEIYAELLQSTIPALSLLLGVALTAYVNYKREHDKIYKEKKLMICDEIIKDLNNFFKFSNNYLSRVYPNFADKDKNEEVKLDFDVTIAEGENGEKTTEAIAFLNNAKAKFIITGNYGGKELLDEYKEHFFSLSNGISSKEGFLKRIDFEIKNEKLNKLEEKIYEKINYSLK